MAHQKFDGFTSGSAYQRGSFMLAMSITLLAASFAVIGSSRFALNQFKENIGKSLGVEVQTIATSLGLYIAANEAVFLAGRDVPNVVNDLAPTVNELIALNFLDPSISLVPRRGGAYVIRVIAPPANPPGQRHRGTVHLAQPIIGPDGLNADIGLMGPAMSASNTNQIGFSMPANRALITGPNWTLPNPVVGQPAGILLANVTLNGVVNAQRFWLESVATPANLPQAGNIEGDVRLDRWSQKPMTWDGGNWVELFTRGNNNLAIGSNTGNALTTGNDNIFIGAEAGRKNKDAQGNVFTGTFSGQANTSGSANVFSGWQSGAANTTGGSNVFIGRDAGLENTSGGSNTFIGYSSGVGNRTGDINTFIGRNSGSTKSDVYNSTALGSDALVTGSNQIRLGNAQVTSVFGPTYRKTSDRTQKSGIEPSERGLEFIKMLKPVDYTLTSSNVRDTGFIAQDVEAVDPSFPGVAQPAGKDDFYTLAYMSFIPSMVKAIQQLDSKLAQQASRSLSFQDDVSLIKKIYFLLALSAVLLLSVFILLFIILIVKKNQYMRDIQSFRSESPPL